LTHKQKMEGSNIRCVFCQKRHIFGSQGSQDSPIVLLVSQIGQD